MVERMRERCGEIMPEVTYCPLPDKPGIADVWMRRGFVPVEEEEEGETVTYYECDTVFVRTDKAEEDIEEHFAEYFENPPEWTEPEPYRPPTLEERVEMQEDAIIELAEIIGGLIDG